jgi:transposase
MATLLKVLNNLADIKSAGGVALRVRTQGGRKPRLSEEQLAQSAKIVEAGPDREKDGIVRWRRVDLKRVIAERFGVRRKSRRKADRPRSGPQRVQPVIITFSKCFLILGP